MGEQTQGKIISISFFRINPAGGGQSLKFLLKNMTMGYGAPLIIVLMMIVTEVSVDNCSNFHPRFGQR